MKLTVFLACLGLLAVTGCSSADTVPTATQISSQPTVESTRQVDPTPTPESAFTTFVEASETFSIQYPQDWELRLSQMEAFDESIEQLINDSPGSARTVFMAAIVEDNYIKHSARVTLDALEVELTADQYAEGILNLFRNQFPRVSVVSQQGYSVGEYNARLIEFEGDLADFGGEGRFRNLVLLTTRPNERAGWNVTCSISLPDEDGITDICREIISSFAFSS